MIGKTEKVLALIVSFLFFPVGIVFFIVWFGNENPEKRRLGKQCMILALFPIFFFLLFMILGIVNYVADPIQSGSSEETRFEYTFTGEGKYWKAKYSFSGTEIWRKEGGSTTSYSTESSDKFVLRYKGDLTELSSLKSLEFSYETSIGDAGHQEDFDNPPTDATFTITGSSVNGGLLSDDEVIQVNVKWDDHEESFELHNAGYGALLE